MNAVLSLSHFCETHGPSTLFSTQAFHFAGEDHSGVLEPSGIQFFGSLKKLKEYNEGTSQSVNNAACEACESINGFIITNDYQNKISFLSGRQAVDPNVSSLLKQAAVRSLSCEVVPEREGQIYFGDSASGHILSNTFFLKDTQARGFHRWYSILIFMKDKHFLLNSWPFFRQYINQIVLHLQRQAVQVYANEQNSCSQRAFRLSSFDQKHSTARSLVKLTASAKVFSQLHLWFTWLLSTGAKRLEEHLPSQVQGTESIGESVSLFTKRKKNLVEPKERDIYNLRQLRKTFGAYNFLRVLYSTIIGRQIVVRGPKVIVENIINLLKLFLPSRKVQCQEFGDTYKPPDVCNIVGLDLSAAVPMSSSVIMRLDIVPLQETIGLQIQQTDYAFYKFIVRNECELPEKLPSLLIKIHKSLSNENLADSVVCLQIKSLMEQWFHVAKLIQEVKKKQHESHLMTCLLQSLGVQEHDDQLIEFWTS